MRSKELQMGGFELQVGNFGSQNKEKTYSLAITVQAVE